MDAVGKAARYVALAAGVAWVQAVKLLWLVVVACGLAVSLLALVWAGQRRLIYFPFGRVPLPASVGLADAEQVTFTTADGVTLRGWYVPAATSADTPATCTMIVFNGNAGNRAYRAPLALAFRARGVALLLFDYRGYGDSAGSPDERGLTHDARAARAYVQARPDVDAARIVYFGESLGAAVAVELAIAHTPMALVLRSPFTSMADVGRVHYPILPVGLLLRDRFASIERIADVRAPLLVIAGDGDGIVPLAQSRTVYDAATSPKQFVVVEGADHNDADLVAGPVVVAATMRFLEQSR